MQGNDLRHAFSLVSRPKLEDPKEPHEKEREEEESLAGDDIDEDIGSAFELEVKETIRNVLDQRPSSSFAYGDFLSRETLSLAMLRATQEGVFADQLIQTSLADLDECVFLETGEHLPHKLLFQALDAKKLDVSSACRSLCLFAKYKSQQKRIPNVERAFQAHRFGKLITTSYLYSFRDQKNDLINPLPVLDQEEVNVIGGESCPQSSEQQIFRALNMSDLKNFRLLNPENWTRGNVMPNQASVKSSSSDRRPRDIEDVENRYQQLIIMLQAREKNLVSHRRKDTNDSSQGDENANMIFWDTNIFAELGDTSIDSHSSFLKNERIEKVSSSNVLSLYAQTRIHDPKNYDPISAGENKFCNRITQEKYKELPAEYRYLRDFPVGFLSKYDRDFIHVACIHRLKNIYAAVQFLSGFDSFEIDENSASVEKRLLGSMVLEMASIRSHVIRSLDASRRYNPDIRDRSLSSLNSSRTRSSSKKRDLRKHPNFDRILSVEIALDIFEEMTVRSRSPTLYSDRISALGDCISLLDHSVNIPREFRDGMSVRLWEPDARQCEASALTAFRHFVNTTCNQSLHSYADLYTWSVNEYPTFWKLCLEFLEIVFSGRVEEIVEDVPMQTIPRWFTGITLNFAENVLARRNDSCEENGVAVISEVEGGSFRTISWKELREQVSLCSQALRRMGIQKGDVIGTFSPNVLETVVVMLSASCIGAVYSSCSPDFGTAAVEERFGQIRPKVIFASQNQRYRHKLHNLVPKIRDLAALLPSVESWVLFNFFPDSERDCSLVPNHILWDSFLSIGKNSDGSSPPLEYEQLPFSHPMYIMYSSGTTGKPKCIVHSLGGTLLKHKCEHILHVGVKESDVVYFYTTTAWMMWHWTVSALTCGATIVLFDGSPFDPSPGALFEMADRHKINVFGSSAKYWSSLESVGYEPISKHNLSSIQSILSTGSPLKDESFDFIYDKVKHDVMLSSISGGTDIISCFVGGNPTLPVYRGEIQCRLLGMAVEAFDGNAQPVYDSEGELVCVKPFPCMPVFFWEDDDGSKYFKAYFSSNSGVWTHGDFVTIVSETGGIRMHGRSDATLNPSGVRFGSAELYHIVERFDDIADSLAVGQIVDDDERVILFVMMKPGKELGESLMDEIKKSIRNLLSPRHVPALILPVSDIPYTMNGKKVEVAVKQILNGKDGSANRDALANPTSLDIYRAFVDVGGILYLPEHDIAKLRNVPSWSRLSSDASSSSAYSDRE